MIVAKNIFDKKIYVISESNVELSNFEILRIIRNRHLHNPKRLNIKEHIKDVKRMIWFYQKQLVQNRKNLKILEKVTKDVS